MAPSCDPQLLRRIQLATTDVLIEFDRVCTLLQCEYVMYGGTAIGAARHQGFIPWDDDADVCMPRADYERFLAHAPKHLNPNFYVVDPQHTPHYPTTFAVIGIKGSQFISTTAKDRPFTMPIGVDIFPLDDAAPSPRAFSRQCRSTWLWGRLLFLQGTPSPHTGLPTPLAQTASAIMHTTHWALRAAQVQSQDLYKRWEAAARRHTRAVNNSDNATHPDRLLADFSTRDPQHWSVRYSELFPAGEAEFENAQLKMPRLYDQVLTRGYGDYMTEPDEADRVNHQPHHIDFGPWTEPGSLFSEQGHQ